MTDHVWEIEEVDGGPAGVSDFWICRVCGSSGGLAWDSKKPPTGGFFFAGHNHKGLCTSDCAETKMRIDRYKASPLYRQTLFNWQYGHAVAALHILEKRQGVGGNWQ